MYDEDGWLQAANGIRYFADYHWSGECVSVQITTQCSTNARIGNGL